MTHFVLLGGFLGSGKTTATLRLAEYIRQVKGLKVGVITNDQATGLVDTALARQAKFTVFEIGGACFCCQSNTLVDAVRDFSARAQPDVIIAEPVGSCADLVATVLRPMQSIYKVDCSLAPMVVMADPFRLEAILTGRASSGFADVVKYIYRK